MLLRSPHAHAHHVHAAFTWCLSSRALQVRSPDLTYAATVRHLCGAIRKLAAVQLAKGMGHMLWRGTRGVLPPTFWTPDDLGSIFVTEFGCLSTSKNKVTPFKYLNASGSNVIWQVRCSYPLTNACIPTFTTQVHLFPPPAHINLFCAAGSRRICLRSATRAYRPTPLVKHTSRHRRVSRYCSMCDLATAECQLRGQQWSSHGCRYFDALAI